MKKSCLRDLSLGLLLVFLMQSCSIQQRRYTGGLSIQWPSIHTQKTKSTSTEQGTHHSQPMLRSPKDENNFNAVSKRNELQSPQQEVKMPKTPEEIAIDNKTRGNVGDQPMGVITDPSNSTSTLYQTQKSTHKAVQWRNQLQHQIHHQAQGTRPGDPLEVIFIVLGIVGALLGYDSYSGGGGSWGGGGGGYFDWTVFFAIAGATVSAGGLILTIALKSSMSSIGLEGMMGFFTVIGIILNTIGLIKSIRDYYDVGKYLSIAAFVLLAVMWIIGLT
jgi:hypothetical protein